MGNITHICISSDNNYVKPMATVMASVLCNSDNELCFHIFDGGISAENKAKLEELKKIKDCSINFIAVDKELFAKFPTIGHLSTAATHITTAAYYRYLVSSLIEADKVLYLDCDIIVDKNIDELYAVKLDNCYIAAVEDALSEESSKRMGLTHYFNSGVLLINSSAWRADNVEQQLFAYTAEHIGEILSDQDVFNAVCQGKIKFLENKWNWQNHRIENKNAHIHHFTGPRKPWNHSKTRYHYELYWKYCALTAWAHEHKMLRFVQKLHYIRRKIKNLGV